MAMHSGTARAARWGADLPVDEEQARERLLQAAETCYARHGPSRTTMTHIAHEAGVHRTTVYSYFPNRDAVLAACFVRAVAGVIAAADPYFDSDEPFSERLVKALLVGLEAARNSPAMRMLIAGDELTRTHRAAEASEIWREDLRASLGQRFAEAAAEGEVRDDVPPETLTHWTTRICFSLIADPGKPEHGGDEGLLRAFLPTALAPPAR
ncbi:TetR/AcrR family transcriptional regulator [Mycolicibacter senuensis]|uniref:TetR/AcrR family transcriptional regulator n=1 Tax=Mycolicibacter senuensis TaxID=386913 RepID=UPI000DCC96BB|nr:TetR/AcrR family transcriptional regulator [Mycolicibacter senuensis]RAV03947.1 TetR/AcrR family transcriptional regulator [Mycolicibacter senuensis]